MLKKKVNGSWGLLSNLKKNVNGAWSDCDCVKKLNNGAWSTVWEKKLLDFSFAYGYNEHFSYHRYAKTTAGGDVMVRLGDRISNNPGFSQICVIHSLPLGETVYIDYSYTNNSTNDYYARISFGYNDYGYVRPYGNLLNSESTKIVGTISGTVSGVFDDSTNPYFVFGVYNENVVSNYNVGTLRVTRIYAASKIYYWNTETIKDE